ncbi:MAG: polysaccharide pyruvyl transferase family protein [Ignavibacteriae bacterium]|nr:polysaccharide pyruvyl transferase family protein [Ignavibacteriota bacterium]MCB2092607.1 polysaccharide pyruvyl transferase family protein [Alphaproteobacteria bacterium]
MQGNKGGPALALSLVKQISKFNQDVEFIFTVPSNEEGYKYEKFWGDKYGFKVLKAIGGKNILPPFCFNPDRKKIFNEWVDLFKTTDALLEMSAICYVGPPISNAKSSISRHMLYWLSKFYKKPMIPWTQSYGPFSSFLIKLMAKIDLSNNSVVFCRGENCRRAVQELLPNIQAIAFPDVATVLPYDKDEGREYIDKTLGLNGKSIVTISPSAVLYKRTDGIESKNCHVLYTQKLCNYLTDLGHDVILLPHSTYPNTPIPTRCDHKVCQIVKSGLLENNKVHIIDDDLSPIELKSIIANATIHIGARYHSVVAALSSGIPAISLSWHGKYLDLMTTYNMNEFVLDAVNNDSMNELWLLIEKLLSNKESLEHELIEIQSKIANQVDLNTKMWLDIYSEKKNEL